ncbi:MAG: hypothetical protein KC910_07800 [Candidatus Eremiobacteraeota bacterium]|nr:hypothetical protein [Candidatus Eremiobacteraeota bacterium]
MQIFTPTVTQPMQLAERLITRYLGEGQLMPGTTPSPIKPDQVSHLADSYRRAWDQSQVDDQPGDLDLRPGFIHKQDGRWERFEHYCGDEQEGHSSTTIISRDKPDGEILSVDRRELRATAAGFDYVAVDVTKDGSVRAVATHIDRNTGSGTEQSWYLVV